MTREEAIKILSYRDANGVPCGYAGGITEALDMAIKALEQEPTPNDDYFRKMAGVVISQLRTDRDRLEDELTKREQEPSGDLISRQAVYEVLDSMLDDSSDNKRNQLVSLDSIADEIAELSPVNPQEPSVVFVKTEESNDNDTKYLNINVSDDEVKRNPDIVRLCSDVGILEYAKPQTGHWILDETDNSITCDKCGCLIWANDISNGEAYYCPNCGTKMESEDKE